MTRGHGRLAARNGGGGGSGERPRYTSQPQLTGCDYHMDGRRSFAQPGGGRCDSPDTLSLPPLSARTSVSFPRRSAHERTEAVKGAEEGGSGGGGYPDLARHPLSYTTAPPPQYHANANNQGCSLWRWLVLFVFFLLVN
jgi:hypothetical protein